MRAGQSRSDGESFLLAGEDRGKPGARDGWFYRIHRTGRIGIIAGLTTLGCAVVALLAILEQPPCRPILVMFEGAGSWPARKDGTEARDYSNKIRSYFHRKGIEVLTVSNDEYSENFDWNAEAGRGALDALRIARYRPVALVGYSLSFETVHNIAKYAPSVTYLATLDGTFMDPPQGDWDLGRSVQWTNVYDGLGSYRPVAFMQAADRNLRCRRTSGRLVCRPGIDEGDGIHHHYGLMFEKVKAKAAENLVANCPTFRWPRRLARSRLAGKICDLPGARCADPSG